MTDVEALLCCWLALKLERISIFVLASGMFASSQNTSFVVSFLLLGCVSYC